jgi:hypothetical protein
MTCGFLVDINDRVGGEEKSEEDDEEDDHG